MVPASQGECHFLGYPRTGVLSVIPGWGSRNCERQTLLPHPRTAECTMWGEAQPLSFHPASSAVHSSA